MQKEIPLKESTEMQIYNTRPSCLLCTINMQVQFAMVRREGDCISTLKSASQLSVVASEASLISECYIRWPR